MATSHNTVTSYNILEAVLYYTTVSLKHSGWTHFTMNSDVDVISTETMWRHTVLPFPKHVMHKTCMQPGSSFAFPSRHTVPSTASLRRSMCITMCKYLFTQDCLNIYVWHRFESAQHRRNFNGILYVIEECHIPSSPSWSGGRFQTWVPQHSSPMLYLLDHGLPSDQIKCVRTDIP